MRESERMGVEYSLHDGVKGREERKWVKHFTFSLHALEVPLHLI